MAEVFVRVHDQRTASDELDEVAELYERVYAEPPYSGAAKYSRRRFMDRTRSQMGRPGFLLVTARRDGLLVGFAFGFTMEPGSWWANASAPSGEVLDAAKFAVVELVVTKDERGQGLGRALMDTLLAGRPERFATLAAVLDADAYGMYLRWGWVKAGEFRVEPPFSDALVLALRGDGGGSGA